MRSKILNNFGLKIASVFLAFMLWLVVMNISDSNITVQIKDIPVQQINEQALEELDKVYDVAKGDTVDIIVKGRRSVVEGLNANDFVAQADLSAMSITNTVQIVVSPKSTGIKDEISITCIDNIMRLNLEEKINTQYSVKVKTTGKEKNGYAVCTQTTSPNIINVEGPKSAVEKITEVVVVSDVSNLDKTIDMEGNIVLYDAYGEEIKNDKITVSHEKVKVHIEVYPTKEIPVEVNIKGTPKEGYVMSGVLYQPQSVIVAGDIKNLALIDKIVINDVSVSGMDADLETTVMLKDYLPKDIYPGDDNEEIVITVTVEEIVSKKFNITAEDVSLLQTDSDKEYELELSDDFCIVVKGIDSDVAAFTVEQINPTINCKDFPVGNHNNVTIDLTEVEGMTYEIQGSARMSIVSK